jgi:hypothetical protein
MQKPLLDNHPISDSVINWFGFLRKPQLGSLASRDENFEISHRPQSGSGMEEGLITHSHFFSNVTLRSFSLSLSLLALLGQRYQWEVYKRLDKDLCKEEEWL